MAGSVLVARDAISGVLGETAGTLTILAGLLILLSSINVNFLGMPRVAFALARDRLAPHAFTKVTKRGTPGPALLFISAWILGLALTGAFEWLIRFMMLVAISVDLMVLLSFFRLQKVRPDLPRPFKVPANPWLPGVTILLYVILLAIIVVTQPGLTLGAGGMLVLILSGGLLTTRWRKDSSNQYRGFSGTGGE
jgi:APA family basic amino acid/polyamine antiporter